MRRMGGNELHEPIDEVLLELARYLISGYSAWSVEVELEAPCAFLGIRPIGRLGTLIFATF